MTSVRRYTLTNGSGIDRDTCGGGDGKMRRIDGQRGRAPAPGARLGSSSVTAKQSRWTALPAALGLGLLLLAAMLPLGAAQPVLLRDVNVLTLRQGRDTAHRRVAAVAQMSCVGGDACHLFKPSVMQCYNRGSDGFDVQWECKTDLDNSYRLGETNVACEGYEYPDDPNVLAGSCGVEYTLELTEEGRLRQSARHREGSHDSPPANGDGIGAMLLFGFWMFVIVAACGGGGGGGGGYSSHRSGSGDYYSGLLAGGLLGRMSSGGDYSGYRSGGYGGHGGGGYRSSYSSSSRSGSSGTRTASGFGGTRRR